MFQTLPQGFSLRAPRASEVKIVAQLIVDYDVHYFGEPNYSVEDVRRDWELADLETEAWVIWDDAGGKLAGYAMIHNKGRALYEGEFYAHPEYFDRGLEEQLVARMENHCKRSAMQNGDGEYRLALHADSEVQREKKYIEAAGLKPTFYWMQMLIELDEEPPAAVFPEGLVVRSFEEGDIRKLYDARVEVFQGQRDGDTMVDYEKFTEYMLSPATTDKSLAWLVLDGDEIVAFSLCSHRTEVEMGRIGTLGVKSKYRGQGIGKNLLRAAFREFCRRGCKSVRVTVDSDNPSGATGVYQRAGMKPIKEYTRYEKIVTVS